jgi:hypothetical protein
MHDLTMPAPKAWDLLTYSEARRSAGQDGDLAALHAWLDTYPMRSHPELGRTGAVCPFTRMARKLDTMRVGICRGGPDDEEMAAAVIGCGWQALDSIPVDSATEQFRAVVIGFPNCDSDAGVAMLRRAQRRYKYYAMTRFRMMGFLHPQSEVGGLWNPEFRPLRSPMPALALRCMVEQDAPFIASHRQQWLPFLIKFGLPGARRMLSYRGRSPRRSSARLSGPAT